MRFWRTKSKLIMNSYFQKQHIAPSRFWRMRESFAAEWGRSRSPTRRARRLPPSDAKDLSALAGGDAKIFLVESAAKPIRIKLMRAWRNW